MPAERASTFYPHLSKPLQVRGLALRNRVVMGPHQAKLVDSQGLPNQQLHQYLVARAAGGAGLLIVEGGSIMPNSMHVKCIAAFEPAVVERWAPIVAAVKAQGARIVAQLVHTGRQASNYTFPDHPLWAPSAIPCPWFRDVPKQMEQADIDAYLAAHVTCARHMRQAGFDGVEIHACHGYLINEFLSPYTNKRTDQYGGPLENRMRLLLQVVERMREAVGHELVVGVRLESREMIEGGLDLDETVPIAQTLERTGKIDYLSVSQGVRESFEFIRAPMFMPEAYAVDFTSAIKRAVTLPVFTVGRMTHPDLAEKAIAEGKADAVVMARELIADPEYPRKAFEGRVDEIRRCIGCGECIHAVLNGLPIVCIYNPEIGREGLGRLQQAKQPRRVAIVGAGPAGLEAARVAATRGHTVVVFEKANEIGGALRLAVATPGRAEIGNLVEYYRVQLRRLNVELRLGAEATCEQIQAEKPDVVLVATGARPLMPPSSFLPKVEVAPGSRILSYEEAYSTQWRGTEHVLLVDNEYHAIGMSVADHLVEQKVSVAYLTKAEKPGLRLDGATQKMWFRRICTRGVSLHPFRSLLRVAPGVAEVRFDFSGSIEQLPCDAVVYAYTRRADDDLYHALKRTDLDVRRIGDCLAPRAATFAVRDGFEAAAAL